VDVPHLPGVLHDHLLLRVLCVRAADLGALAGNEEVHAANEPLPSTVLPHTGRLLPRVRIFGQRLRNPSAAGVPEGRVLLAAFVLIVLFWVELQTQVQRMQGIEKLKPYLIGILSFYTGVRLLAALSQLFFPKFKNALNALTILVYVSIMVIGQYYGQQLLAKMKQMSDKEFKKQLMKLTLFIILENITMVILLIVFLVRTYGFQTAKFREPWKWFWLKLLEKVMELLSIIVLSLTMLGDSGKKKSSAPAAATATAGASVRRAKKKPGSTSVDVANPVLVATQAQQGVVIEMPEAGMEGSKKHLLQ